ncbi:MULTISPECIES: cytochrome c oxidase subunit I [Sporosarcina]|uniref:cytochrome c oxidase subunit I n=1 Tax=Sporosarcina TaxID=1569 RepID=UPI00129B2C0E|nr:MULTISPECIES: cytochrome c oxidase subunit I [Sporosarcina]GKV64314.1 cytochrome c oxidase subunit 1 [Sporosarcina sp. NCCP-2331]GLB54222.1 cytochrome c oxidase subunit 1 [Sporosarcina sp. NCCP-2378]
MSSVAQKTGFGATLWDWLTTVDHKKIGILYLLGGLFFFVLGGIEAMIIRLQLMTPNNDLVSAGLFNDLITMHGTTMIFLAAMPILFGFMNAIMPLQIGARDVAFPFINSLGFWMFVFGGLFLNISWLFGEVPDAGWTSYASLSLHSPGHGIDFYAIGLQIAGGGTLMAGINFLVTIINMRAPGMTYMRMPLFTWTTFVASAMILFAFPPLTVGLFFLTFDRMFSGNFFDHTMGGNTIIWEHIFWIFGHPEVYILILPAFGIFSEIFSVFSRKRLFGYTAMVFATVLIGFLGFMVWAHHMFTVGLGPTANAIFAVATMAIAVPTGVKIFNWLLTIWGGSIKVTTPMLYALGFIPSFVMGGVTGVMQGAAPLDYQLHDTYFIVAHFHYVIIGGVVLAIFAALHYWWPKMFGTMLNEFLGKITFVFFFIGFHMTFLIQHWLGFWGMPRRVWTYMDGQGWNMANMISTIGALLMAIGFIVMVINILMTTIKNERVGNDPWGDGRTLEWAIGSPPVFYNFAATPLVRGLDTLWIEKMEGSKEMITPAEPITDIHMPNGSIIPMLMSLGLFIAGFGAMFHQETSWGLPVLVFGLAFTFVSMAARSLRDDLGFYVTKEQIMQDLKNKGGRN